MRSARPAFTATLRGKFLLSLTLISALLTFAVLLTIQYRVRVHARGEIAQALRNSVVTFQSLQQQRDLTLGRSTALVATLPPLKAVMTTDDRATIQNASKMFWELAGSDIFVLANRSGELVALHTSSPGLDDRAAKAGIARYAAGGEARDWWFGGGRLYQVFLEPIFFGAPDEGHPMGILAVGYEIDARAAQDLTRVAASQLGFGYDRALVLSTVPDAQREALARHVAQVTTSDGRLDEVRLGGERFLATSVKLSSGGGPLVTLTLLESFDQATAVLQNLNRWILAIGIVAVVLGSALVFFVSTTFTRPLGRLVAGVRALEKGDFAYPLDVHGRDEVSTVTAAFDRMRQSLRDTQAQLLEAEQLATIGRMASTISHDLRHPLTAILAYTEFLSERDLTDEQRKDFFQEVRIAVNRMMDEINSLLGFSKQSEALAPSFSRVDAPIDRAVRTMKALPEYESIVVTVKHAEECVGWFDAPKLERVMLNLLFNAAEAVSPESGRIDVSCHVSERGTEIRVADNGPGIPESIAGSLFQPFVSYGKEKGIGLGLTVVRNIMQQHHGDVSVERTGPDGTVIRLFFPARADAAPASENTDRPVGSSAA
jgi:signal transduction histidine kinase